jgi:hypothetical protein
MEMTRKLILMMGARSIRLMNIFVSTGDNYQALTNHLFRQYR